MVSFRQRFPERRVDLLTPCLVPTVTYVPLQNITGRSAFVIQPNATVFPGLFSQVRRAQRCSPFRSRSPVELTPLCFSTTQVNDTMFVSLVDKPIFLTP